MPEERNWDSTLVDLSPSLTHGLWQATKAKHAAAIEAGKIKFDKGLGPLLERRAAQWKPVLAWKRMKKPLPVIGKQLRVATMLAEANALKSTSKAVVKIANDYKKKIRGLGGDAEKDLNDTLARIIRRAEHDVELMDTGVISKLKK